ncbi:hypothetical protein CVV43_03430 [Candidatus Saccharibacteria bacterium HGW-Saccharibacteria-1]|jgi:hypothetical protein|nr:MAG: hypothetical protein CVV43_03430 [Candidatus Saccharibacteria bacterium HGW-Saccharibacteria-1]
MPRRNKANKIVRSQILMRDNCDSKNQYLTKKQATEVAEYQMLINFNLELSVYKCESCYKWHLTRQSKASNKPNQNQI